MMNEAHICTAESDPRFAVGTEWAVQSVGRGGSSGTSTSGEGEIVVDDFFDRPCL